MSKLSADEAAGNYVSENDMMKLPISSSPSSPSSNGGKGSSGCSNRALVVKRILRATLLFVAATVGCFIISGFLLGSYYDNGLSSHQDTDIMWLRDPFPQFYSNADFQIACDFFNGDSYSVNNFPNGGFTYVKSNHRTIKFYKFWYFSRKAYPKKHDQDVLNKIKFDRFLTQIGLKMRFLDTLYFGGFCQASKDFNQVCTMHANCCVGLENKVNDLKILLQVWRKYMSLPPNTTAKPQLSWTVPQNCSTSFQRLGKHS